MIMKLILRQDTGTREIEVEVTRTLDDLVEMIRDICSLTDPLYQFDIEGERYTHAGGPDTAVCQCDLFLYLEEPVLLYIGDTVIALSHENVLDNIYDYCDFENPHYCSALEGVIDIDTCYTSMMCLNGFVAPESSPALAKIGDLELARERCGRCLYTNCDGIHREQILNNLPLVKIDPYREAYRVHLEHVSPDKAEKVRKRFLKRISTPNDEDE